MIIVQSDRDTLMKVSDLAKAAEVNPDTVRFSTREGLLSPT